MSSALLAGQPTLSTAMPTLLVLLLALVGATLVVIGSGWACGFVRSRGATIAGSLCLLGTIPASGATSGVAAGILLTTGAAAGAAIVIALAGMLLLVAAH